MTRTIILLGLDKKYKLTGLRNKDYKLTELGKVISTRQVLMRQLVIPPEEKHSSQVSRAKTIRC